MNFGHGFDSRQVHLSTVSTGINVEILMLYSFIEKQKKLKETQIILESKNRE